MCKSQSDGGQRCAAHTRPAYENTSIDDPKWDDAAAQYASTPEGKKRLTEQAETSAAQGDYDTEARLKSALVRGADIRDANADAGSAIAHADLTTWAPVDVDTELARLHGEAATLRGRRDTHYGSVARHVAREVHGRGFRGTATRAEVEEAVAAWRTEENLHPNSRSALREYDNAVKAEAQIADLNAQIEPYDREFNRRGGWTRAFLVTNGNGHVHKSLNCSTCRPTTQYEWRTELSDHDEAEIIEAAGERACTCCYPDAPAETRNRPSIMFTEQELSQQEARVARATAAQERDAKKIANALTPDGSEFRVECTRNGYPDRQRFKTERSATIWVVGNMSDYRGWRSDQTMDPSMAAAHETIIEAIAAKHDMPVDEVRADIEKKVAAKVARDAKEARRYR